MSCTTTDPPANCRLCPRLAEFRQIWHRREPSWFNAPVPTFSDITGKVELLIVGLAPGLRGANRTGRPFTGDFAGELLYSTLLRYGFAAGRYGASPGDGLSLTGCAITNAVRCVPPANKPVGSEIANCRTFLTATVQDKSALRAVMTLGKIAHESTVRALSGRIAAAPFSHGGTYDIAGLRIFSSYHCSRYNTNTGRLTPQMFADVFHEIVQFLREGEPKGERGFRS